MRRLGGEMGLDRSPASDVVLVTVSASIYRLHERYAVVPPAFS